MGVVLSTVGLVSETRVTPRVVALEVSGNPVSAGVADLVSPSEAMVSGAYGESVRTDAVVLVSAPKMVTNFVTSSGTGEETVGAGMAELASVPGWVMASVGDVGHKVVAFGPPVETVRVGAVELASLSEEAARVAVVSGSCDEPVRKVQLVSDSELVMTEVTDAATEETAGVKMVELTGSSG